MCYALACQKLYSKYVELQHYSNSVALRVINTRRVHMGKTGK